MSLRNTVKKVFKKPLIQAMVAGVIVIVGVAVLLIANHSHNQLSKKADIVATTSSPKKTTTSNVDKSASQAATSQSSSTKGTPAQTASVAAPPACGGTNDTCTAPFSITSAGECNGITQATCVLQNVPTQNRFADYPPSSTAEFYGPKQTNGSSSTYFTYAVSCSLDQCGQESGGPISGQQFTTSQTAAHITIDFTTGTSTSEDVTMQAQTSYVYTDTSSSPAVHIVKHFKNWNVNLTNSINFSMYQVYPAYSSVCAYSDGQPVCT